MIAERIEQIIKELLEKYFQPVSVADDKYTKMKWPKLIPLMRFGTERFSLPGFGHAAFVRNQSLGFVQLLTCSITPDEGAAVPYLMVEVMEAKEKYTAFVEYYNCTVNGTDTTSLEEIAGKYAELDDYPEKPTWYIEKRAKGSVSKFATEEDKDQLCEMVRDSVGKYLEMAAKAEKSPENIKGLIGFGARMINEGNPLSETFNTVLGKTEADVFFKKVVMPLNWPEEHE